MANNGAPDSWETQADGASGDVSESSDVSAKFSTLNVNAAEFVPSFSFIPSQTEPNPQVENTQTTATDPPVINGVPPTPMETEGEPPGEGSPPPPPSETPAADSWEAADDSDPIPPSLLTPDDDEELDELEEEIVIKPKKKPKSSAEEQRSKKEHVNVVIIGHVGE